MDYQIQFDASQHVGERCYKHTDGITYQISEDGQYATVKACELEVVEANIANEIAVVLRKKHIKRHETEKFRVFFIAFH